MNHFTCNICKTRCSTETVDREVPSCAKCGSNVRHRWIVHALSVELFRESLLLHDFPRRKDLRGLGMSDALFDGVLAKRFNYRNTFYHREPHFDITAATGEAEYDFIIASEVFEHVRPPVQTAFNNLARLLKPRGFAVFSAPWELEGGTLEHFPELHDWHLVQLRSGHALVNRTAGGRLEVFDNLQFHGGIGSTLEMRVFSKAGLLANCAAAGFAEPIMATDYPAYGILWEPWSWGMVLRKREP